MPHATRRSDPRPRIPPPLVIYERQLYESHAHLLTGLLSLIAMELALR